MGFQFYLRLESAFEILSYLENQGGLQSGIKALVVTAKQLQGTAVRMHVPGVVLVWRHSWLRLP